MARTNAKVGFGLLCLTLLVASPLALGGKNKDKKGKDSSPQTVLAATDPAALAAAEEHRAACAPDTPENYQIHVGIGSHPDAGIAKQTAEAQARFRAVQSLCSGKSSTRCASIQRHLEPWKAPHWNPVTFEACALVGVNRKWIDDESGDLSRLQGALAGLAGRIKEEVGDKLLAIDPPIWTKTGCSSAEVGAALTVELKNALAREGEIKLTDATSSDALRLRIELTDAGDKVLLAASVRDPKRQGYKLLPGFDFPMDLYMATGEANRCAGDDKLGLKDGYREGEGGLVARLELGTESSVFCEGTTIRPRVVVNQSSQVKVFSVTKDDRALLIWPPPKQRGFVENTMSLGEVTLFRDQVAGDEKLVVVAVPISKTFTHMDGWTGFCQIPGPFDNSAFPQGSAGASVSYHVLPFDAPECVKEGRTPMPPPQMPPLPTCPSVLGL